MKRLSTARPTPALLVAMVALVAAMSGAAVALPGTGKVKSNDIAKDAVRSKHIEKNAIRSQEVEGKSLKGNDLKDGAIDTKQLKDDAVDSSKIADYEVLGGGGPVKVAATDGATAAAAEAAAPETELFSEGQLTIYAKCFRATGPGTIHGEIYARTAADGAILAGADSLPNSDATLLTKATPEAQARLAAHAESNANAGSTGLAQAALIAPDGTDLHVLAQIAVKQGTLANGDGAFGAGNVCLFGGAVTG